MKGFAHARHAADAQAEGLAVCGSSWVSSSSPWARWSARSIQEQVMALDMARRWTGGIGLAMDLLPSSGACAAVFQLKGPQAERLVVLAFGEARLASSLPPRNWCQPTIHARFFC